MLYTQLCNYLFTISVQFSNCKSLSDLSTFFRQVMKIFEYSDGLVIFVFFILYAIASISFCFCIRYVHSKNILKLRLVLLKVSALHVCFPYKFLLKMAKYQHIQAAKNTVPTCPRQVILSVGQV